jgi:hypothetical protein
MDHFIEDFACIICNKVYHIWTFLRRKQKSNLNQSETRVDDGSRLNEESLERTSQTSFVLNHESFGLHLQ